MNARAEVKAKRYSDTFGKALGDVLKGQRQGLANPSDLVPAGQAKGNFAGIDGVLLPSDLAGKIVDGLAGKALVSDATTGSYLVAEQQQPTVHTNPADATRLLSRVTFIPNLTGPLHWPVLVQSDSAPTGGVVVEWGSEGDLKPEKEPEFEDAPAELFLIHAYTEVSSRLLTESGPDLDAFVASIFRQALRFALAGIIINGSSTGQPLGILNAAGIRPVPRAGAGAIAWSDMVDVKHALHPWHQQQAIYVVSDAAESHLETNLAGE